MTNFFAMITSRTLWSMFPHVIAGAIVTGAFFVVGISAYQILKNRDNKLLFERSLRLGLIVALISGVAVLILGDVLGKTAVATQPMKMAATEALWQTASPAPWTAFAILDPAQMKDVFAIKIPYLLSFLSDDSFTSTVQGVQELQAQAVQQYGPGNYVPPVTILFYAFRIMVGVGSLLPLLAIVGLYLMRKKLLEKTRWFLWVLFVSLFLPYLANSFGWVLTEMGRQPWLVYGVLKTSAGVSSLSPGLVLFSLIVFILLYGILAVIDVILLSRVVRQGIPDTTKKTESEQAAEEVVVVSY
jgi:cytochrome bd ubiquinol oxidase subunit I